MRAAGITAWGGAVQPLDLPDPRLLRADEVLIQVAASGVGYWEDVVRLGDRDVGGALPMALGVETAGIVTAVGSEVTVFGVGDEVLTHCVPLREQGAWAEQAICAAAD